MDIFTQLLRTTELVLRIWEHKEKKKYFEEFRSLQRRIKNEYDKGEHLRDMSVIDHAEFELLLLTRKIVETATTPTRSDT